MTYSNSHYREINWICSLFFYVKSRPSEGNPPTSRVKENLSFSDSKKEARLLRFRKSVFETARELQMISAFWLPEMAKQARSFPDEALDLLRWEEAQRMSTSPVPPPKVHERLCKKAVLFVGHVSLPLGLLIVP